MVRTILRTSVWSLLAVLLLAQDSDVIFQSVTNLVLVPFNVERGKYYAEDLQPSDFVLREDGSPRDFTIFEGPHTPHPVPLELDLLFDASVLPKNSKEVRVFSRWNAKETYEFLNDWDAEITQGILHTNGMDVRLSVYHYEANQWERLFAGTNDPQIATAALHRILDPIPEGLGELTPLSGKRTGGLVSGSSGWLEEATAATLRDAAGSPLKARHIVIWFSSGCCGGGGSGLHTDLLASQASAAGMTIDPVIVNFDNVRALTQEATGSFSVPVEMANGTTHYVDAPLTGEIGRMTGGQLFVRNHLDRDGLAQILTGIRNKAASGYQIGFVPDKSAKTRKHDLEVKMTSKDKGKLVGGRRSDVVY
jgi:VWFA-related protein